MLAADPDGWEFLLARAKLEEMRKQRREALQAPDQWAAYTAHTLQFDRRVKESLDGRKKRQEALSPLCGRSWRPTMPTRRTRPPPC